MKEVKGFSFDGTLKLAEQKLRKICIWYNGYNLPAPFTSKKNLW
tara:strand:+ start:270 stop:401 length:132 start_codon:yes stop_codon:yes gene_type:complete